MRGFVTYLQRQFVTEFFNINSLEYHRIWSTIKSLPATEPETSSMDREPRAEVLRLAEGTVGNFIRVKA